MLNSDIVLLLKGGSACLSQSSAAIEMPVMNVIWERADYLASVIFPIFEHVHDITDLPKRGFR
jgi:hypothetical protein